MAQGLRAGPCRRGARRCARAQGKHAVLTLGEAIRAVLLAAEPRAKVRAARDAARDWRLGRLAWSFGADMPDAPARPDRPELLAPGRMPKRGKGGSEASRIALLHALAHIEFVAIDLAADLVGRFGEHFPRAFADDWIKVLGEEAMHFAMLHRRLRQLGSRYGALPAHGGLWEAASETAHDPLARLAVVPMVLEARGLDVTPQTVERLETAGDHLSARLLGRILRDEINHVAAGVRWFESGAVALGERPEDLWQALVARHFRGRIKGPFNASARAAAGLTPFGQSLVAD